MSEQTPRLRLVAALSLHLLPEQPPGDIVTSASATSGACTFDMTAEEADELVFRHVS
jgi:hypothetical protein